MPNLIRLSDELLRSATIYAGENNCSVEEQIENWATAGRKVEQKDKGEPSLEEQLERAGPQIDEEPGSSIPDEILARGLPVVGGLDDDDPTVYIKFPCGAIEEYAEHKLDPGYKPG